MERRQIVKAALGMLSASIIPGAIAAEREATIFRKVERLVDGKPSAIEFEHLRPGDIYRFTDTPHEFRLVMGDPIPVDPPGNFSIECSGKFTATDELLADPGALAKVQKTMFEPMPGIRDMECSDCGGLGRRMDFGGTHDNYLPCKKCNSTGRVPVARPPLPGEDNGDRA